MKVDYKLNDIVIMKKPHPCGSNKWQIVRVGADLKNKWINLLRTIMLERVELNKMKTKKLIVTLRTLNQFLIWILDF